MGQNNSLTCPIPQNINALTSVGFKLSITKLPEVSFFCTSANLPEIDLGFTSQGTPLSDAIIPGDKLTYGTLEVEFLVDADMTNYKAVYEWLTALGFPEDWEQYSSLRTVNNQLLSELATNYSDMVLTILDASNNQLNNVTFVNAFPVSLSGINFTSKANDIIYVAGSMKVKYSYYHF